jgi:hypothetical protein
VYGLRPYPVYLFISGAFGLFFMLYATIASVYRIQTVGLNPLQLVLVGTALELAVLIFEVPTGVLVFALTGSLVFAIGAFWLVGIARRLGEPLYLAWLNQGLEPGVRATVISMGSQSNALGQVAGGPAIGAVGTLAGIRAALAAAAITLSPALLLYARAIRRGLPRKRN